jgi:hypothetical protein
MEKPRPQAQRRQSVIAADPVGGEQTEAGGPGPCLEEKSVVRVSEIDDVYGDEKALIVW